VIDSEQILGIVELLDGAKTRQMIAVDSGGTSLLLVLHHRVKGVQRAVGAAREAEQIEKRLAKRT
jgi:hypothetical protein